MDKLQMNNRGSGGLSRRYKQGNGNTRHLVSVLLFSGGTLLRVCLCLCIVFAYSLTKLGQHDDISGSLRGATMSSSITNNNADNEKPLHMEDSEVLAVLRSNDEQQKLPNNWENFTKLDTKKWFGCGKKSHIDVRALYTLEDWQLLQDKIKQHVDSSANFEDVIPPTQGYTLGNNKPTPFYAKFSDGKGRGLFATRDIKKGELVHDGEDSNSDIVFPNAMSFRRLVLNLPKKQACDMIEWPWTQRLDDGKLHLVFSPNISIYMNSGYGRPGNTLPDSETSRKMYAVKDIMKDEEIITKYSMYENNWDEVGLKGW